MALCQIVVLWLYYVCFVLQVYGGRRYEEAEEDDAVEEVRCGGERRQYHK